MARLFIALPASEALQNQINSWVRNHSSMSVRWIAPKNLHITLIPPWEEQNVDSLKNKFSLFKPQTSGFELLFEKVTFGPTAQQPRLIWATGKTPEALLNLKSELEQYLNIVSQNRSFNLHLTLARFKSEAFVNLPQKTLNDNVH